MSKRRHLVTFKGPPEPMGVYHGRLIPDNMKVRDLLSEGLWVEKATMTFSHIGDYWIPPSQILYVESVPEELIRDSDII